MLRMRWLGAGLVVLALGGAVRAAAESPLAQVPASAPVVVHLRGFERAKGRLLALLDKALPAAAARDARAGLEGALKKHFKGRTLKGLPADGSIFLVVTKLPPMKEPQLAFVVQVTDYAAFRDGLLKEDERKALKSDAAGIETTTIDGAPSYFVDRKGYAVLAAHKETAALFTRKQPGLDGKLSKGDARKLLGADLSFYVDTVAINKAYGKEIREGRALLDMMLGHMILSHAGDKGAKEMAKELTDRLLQALDDSRLVLACVDFPPEGLALHYRLDIKSGTKTHALLKTFKLSPFAELARLPSGQLGYTALQVEPALLKTFPTWLYGLSAGPGGEHDKVIRRAVKQLTAAAPKARFSSIRLPRPEVQLWLYEDPAKAVKARLQILQALQAGDIFEGGVLKGKPEVGAEAIPYRGFQFHHASLSWDIDKMIAAALLPKDFPAEQQKKMATTLKKMIGEGKKIWFGTDGKVFLQVAARDWANARGQIDAYLDGKEVVGRQQAFRDTRQRLPAKTTLLQLVETTAYVQMLGEFLRASALATSHKPAADFKVPSIARGKTAYLGMAFTLRPEGGSLDAWVPASAVGQFYTAFAAILHSGEKAP